MLLHFCDAFYIFLSLICQTLYLISFLFLSSISFFYLLHSWIFILPSSNASVWFHRLQRTSCGTELPKRWDRILELDSYKSCLWCSWQSNKLKCVDCPLSLNWLTIILSFCSHVLLILFASKCLLTDRYLLSHIDFSLFIPFYCTGCLNCRLS